MTFFPAFPQHLADSAEEKNGEKQAVSVFLRKKRVCGRVGGRNATFSAGCRANCARLRDENVGAGLSPPVNHRHGTTGRLKLARTFFLRIFRWRRRRQTLRRLRLATVPAPVLRAE